MKLRGILEKALSGERLHFEDAVRLLKESDLLSLAYAGNAVCKAKHPEGIATFQIDRNINYTNICVNQCSFCAFYRKKEQPDAYVLSHEEIEEKVDEAIRLSGTQVMLQGGINPDLGLAYYRTMFSRIKKKFRVRIHSLSPPEIVHIADSEDMTVSGVLRELVDAGLDSLPGGGAEILVDRVRQRISQRKISSERWLEVMEEAHALGLKTTATMMMGTVETVEERVEHMQRIRDLQDSTGGFLSFIPWTFQPGNTSLGGRPVSSVEYLKTLSVSRLFLDNVENIQGSWVTQGKDIGQLCLAFGANDLGSTMIEENVVRAAGVSHRMSVEGMVELIRGAGRIPAQRDTEFRILTCYEMYTATG
jgi:cyclic dehypoxanthinyl futalosine synthase